MGSTPGSGRCLGGGNGNPFQYSFPESPIDRGALWAMVHEVAKSQTDQSDLAGRSDENTSVSKGMKN